MRGPRLSPRQIAKKQSTERTEVPANLLVQWIGLAQSKYFSWRARNGKANEHKAWVPRDHWLDSWEKGSIVKYATEHPLDGYRRLTFTLSDPYESP